jgi:predicted nucleotidyltransferase
MRPSEALRRHLPQVRAALARHGVTDARVFGSVARGEDAEGSDLDLLVDPPAGASLFDLAGLALELEALLGVRVDLATPGAVGGRIAAGLARDARAL